VTSRSFDENSALNGWLQGLLFTSVAPAVAVKKFAELTGQTLPNSVDDTNDNANGNNAKENLVDPVSQHYSFQSIHHVSNNGKDQC
jgi:hypothetical protein